MNRADTFGKRILRLRGGSSLPLYKVLFNNTGDTSRGIAGGNPAEVVELFPRPTLTIVTAEQVAQQSLVLQWGDYKVELTGEQVTEEELQSNLFMLKHGGLGDTATDGKLFKLVSHEPKYINSRVSHYLVYLRGAA